MDNLPQFAFLTAIVAAVAAFWSQLKGFLVAVSRYLIQEVELDKDDYSFPDRIANWAWETRRVVGPRVLYYTYLLLWRTDNQERMYSTVFREDGQRPYWIRCGWWGFVYIVPAVHNDADDSPRTSGSASGGGVPSQTGYMRMYAIRGTVDFDWLLGEVNECERKRQVALVQVTDQKVLRVEFWPHQFQDKGGHSYSEALLRSNYTCVDPMQPNLTLSWISPSPALDELYVDDEVLQATREVEEWLQSREWFRERGIRWQRGWQLFGAPGTGKSSLVRALARRYNLPIHIARLGLMSSDSTLEHMVDEASGEAPAIILVEDLDAVFEGRKNIIWADRGAWLGAVLEDRKGGSKSQSASKHGDDDVKHGVTFDGLLNIVDGVVGHNGLFWIFTTNHREKIDPALGGTYGLDDHTGISMRPGRIDRAICLGSMSPANKWKLAQRILQGMPETLAEFERILPSLGSQTPAQVQEQLVSMALQAKWGQHYEVGHADTESQTQIAQEGQEA